ARRCACAPVFSAAARGASALAPGGAGMLAVSVPQLAEALTPSCRFSCFSPRAAQLAQVIPPTSRSISSRAGTCWESMVIEHSDRLPQRPHHIPLGGMKGRGVAEPPRDRRPRPRPHPPYPIPLKPRALQRCWSEGARQRLRRTRRHVPLEVTTPLEVTPPPDASCSVRDAVACVGAARLRGPLTDHTQQHPQGGLLPGSAPPQHADGHGVGDE